MRVVGVKQPVPFYTLDVIISVGYRVKSKRGVEFRRWWFSSGSELKEKDAGMGLKDAISAFFMEKILCSVLRIDFTKRKMKNSGSL